MAKMGTGRMSTNWPRKKDTEILDIWNQIKTHNELTEQETQRNENISLVTYHQKQTQQDQNKQNQENINKNNNKKNES